MAFLLSEILKDILFAAVFSVCLQIEICFAAPLGKRCLQLLRCFLRRQRRLDTVQHRHIACRKYQIGVGLWIRRTQLKARCHRTLGVAHQSDQDCPVSGRFRRAVPQRGHNADRRLISRFQSVQRIGRRADERIDRLVVLEDTHQRTEAHRRKEFRVELLRRKQIDHLAVFEFRADAQMRMLAVSGNARHRFRHKGRRQTKLVEYIAHDIFDLFFVVSRLHRVGVFPVDLQLLHDVVMVAGTGQAGFDAADLLMTHFHLKAVIVQDLDALFESSPNRSISTFPVLLLELLRCRELFSVRLIVRRSDPEFQFGRAGDAELFDIVRAFNAFHILKYIRMLPQELHQVCFEFVDRISEDHARADRMLIVVDQERRNAQGADRQSRQSVDIVKVVVHIPVD